MSFNENSNFENENYNVRDFQQRDLNNYNNITNNQSNQGSQGNQGNQYYNNQMYVPSRPAKHNFHVNQFSNLNIPSNQNNPYPISDKEPYYYANELNYNQNYQINSNPSIPSMQNVNNAYMNVSPHEEYEELKNAYLNQLIAEKNANLNDYSNVNAYSGRNPNFVDKSNKQNSNVEIQNNFNTNFNHNPQYNQILNPTNSISRPMSEKNSDKELKRLKQEEYRRFLDVQMQELNDKKQKFRRESKGLQNSNSNNNSNIQNYSNSPVTGYTPKILNNVIMSNVPVPSELQSPNISEQATTQNNRMVQNMTPSSNPISISNSEKEMEKRKKMEYQNQLLQQIEERKRRQDEEKRKIRQEEAKYEEKFNSGPVDGRGKGRKIVNTNSNQNNTTPNTQQTPFIHQEAEKSPPKINHASLSNNQNFQKQNFQYGNTETKLVNSPQTGNLPYSKDHEFSEEYMNYKEMQFKNAPYPENNFAPSNKGSIPNSIPINNFHYASSQQPIEEENQYTLYPENSNAQWNEIPSALQLNTMNKIQMNNYPMSLLNSYNHTANQSARTYTYNNQNSSSQINQIGQINQMNNQLNKINQMGNIGQMGQMNQMMPAFFEDMLKFFFQEQVKVINTYKETLDKIADERDKAIFQNLASREKMMAMNQLKLEQEKFKTNMGFYPFDNTYNQNIEDMFNNMIEKNYPKQVNQSINKELNRSQNNNNYNLNSVVLKNLQDRPISGMKENAYLKMQQETEVNYLDFRSKYEDLTQSMMSLNFSPNDEKEIPELNQASSKFVKIKPKKNDLQDNEAFLTTWRDDLDATLVSQMSMQNNIPNMNNTNNDPMNFEVTIPPREKLFEYDPPIQEEFEIISESKIENYIKEKAQDNNSKKEYQNAKSVNFPIGKSNSKNIFMSQRDYEVMIISKDEKDKSLYLENSQNNITNKHEEEEIEEINANYSNDNHANFYNRKI